ncbi:MAG: SDR family oxidoreductase [Bacteroidia bacterium]
MKTAIVTGASSGMGKVTAKALAEKGYEVILVCRSKEKGELTLKELQSLYPQASLHLFLCDLSSVKAVKNLAEEITGSFTKIDVLINNAGAYIAKRYTSVDGYELTLATNHLAYFQLTNLLLPLLKNTPEARIVNVASEASKLGKLNWDDLNLEKKYSGILAYSNSKLYNIMFTNQLAEELKGTHITVNAMHPGGVNTNFGNGVDGLLGIAFRQFGWLMRTPEKGAETIIWLATSPEAAQYSGLYFKDKKPIRSIEAAYNRVNLQQLRDVTQELIERALKKV